MKSILVKYSGFDQFFRETRDENLKFYGQRLTDLEHEFNIASNITRRFTIKLEMRKIVKSIELYSNTKDKIVTWQRMPPPL